MADAIQVNPPVRLLVQYDPRWGPKYVHDKETWQSSGCHPSSIYTILRWHAEDSPNRGSFTFPFKEGSEIPADHYPRRGAEGFWPDKAGAVAAHGNLVAHEELMAKACEALGMDKKECVLPHVSMASLKAALANGPLAICMQHPGHFLVLQGIDGSGRLLICDPGAVLGNDSGKHFAPWHNVQTGKGMPPKEQWPNKSPPAYERSGVTYVAVHPTDTFVEIDGAKISFLNAISRAEQYINKKAGAPAPGGAASPQPAAAGGDKPAPKPDEPKPADPKAADQPKGDEGPITEGDYKKVAIQLAGAAAGNHPKRPTKGSQVAWGGGDPSSPWGHLIAQIEKGGGSVNYTFCHAATVDKNLATVRAVVAPETAAETPADPPEGQEHHQPVAPDRPPDAFHKEDPPKAVQQPGEKPSGAIFEKGQEFDYLGHKAAVWAHGSCMGDGKRPLFVYLHGINESLKENHPHLDPKHIHAGKMIGAQIEDGKVSPCVVAAPSDPSNRPWGKSTWNLSSFVTEVVKQAKDNGVEIDLDRVTVTGHSGAGGYGHIGLDDVADQKGKFTVDGAEHTIKLFGLMDTQYTGSAGQHYGSAFKDSKVDIYAVHAGQAGYPDGYVGHRPFALGFGATDKVDSLPPGGIEEADDLWEMFTNSGKSPARISIKVQQSDAKVARRRAAWGATGGYHSHGSAVLHWDLVPLWTSWAPARFFPASQADKDAVAKWKGLAAPTPGKPKQESPPANPKPATGGQTPPAPAGTKPATAPETVITGGTFVLPAAPPIWEPSSGPMTTPAPFADPTSAIYWPVRSQNVHGRQIAHKGSDGKIFLQGRQFLANRDSGRSHVGIDVWGDYKDLVVAIENGTVKNSYHFYHGVDCLIVQCDSGVVINYGEVDPGSGAEFKWRVGSKIKAGQPIARVGRMTGGSSMLHFEIYPAGTTENRRHYLKDGDSDLKARFFDPTQYLISLAKNGK